MGIPMGFYQPEWYANTPELTNGGMPDIGFKRKNRWRFIIPNISASGVNSLPPFRGGKPSISFKEMQGEHLNETIYFPGKPDWKPIALTLYDIVKKDEYDVPAENPVFTWLRRAYDPKNCSLWNPCLQPLPTTATDYNVQGSLKVAQCFLELYDGCGCILEKWVFEHAWPQSVEFADGDMSSNEIVTCDVTLRYDRAYIDTPNKTLLNDMEGVLPSYTCASIPISNIPLSMVNFYAVAPAPEFMVIREPETIQIY